MDLLTNVQLQTTGDAILEVVCHTTPVAVHKRVDHSESVVPRQSLGTRELTEELLGRAVPQVVDVVLPGMLRRHVRVHLRETRQIQWFAWIPELRHRTVHQILVRDQFRGERREWC